LDLLSYESFNGAPLCKNLICQHPLSPEDLNNTIVFLDTLGYDLGENNENLEQVLNDFFKDNYEGYLAAANAINSGLDTNARAALINSINPSETFQGKAVSGAELIAKIQNTEPMHSPYRQAHTEHIEWIKEILREKDRDIANAAQDPAKATAATQWLSNFLFWITAQKGIGASTQIKFRSTARPGFVVHTCFFEAELPGTCDKTNFTKELNCCVADAGSLNMR